MLYVASEFIENDAWKFIETQFSNIVGMALLCEYENNRSLLYINTLNPAMHSLAQFSYLGNTPTCCMKSTE